MISNRLLSISLTILVLGSTGLSSNIRQRTQNTDIKNTINKGLTIESNTQARPSEETPLVNLTVLNVTSSSIEIGWNFPDIEHAEITYLIEYSVINDDKKITIVTNDSKCILTNLEAFTKYVIGISIKDTNIYMDITVRTNVGVPSELQNLTVIEVTSKKLCVRWEPPEHPNGPVDGFAVECRTENITSTWKTYYIYLNQYCCRSIKPWTEYTVTINAYHNGDNFRKIIGPPTNISVKTLPAAPEKCGNITVISRTSSSFEVSWSPPIIKNGILDGYYYFYGEPEQMPISGDFITEEKVSLEHLKSDTNYKFVIRAYNLLDQKILLGPQSFVILRTGRGVPEKIEYITFGDVTNNSIELFWKQKTPYKEVSGYFVDYKTLNDIHNLRRNTSSDMLKLEGLRPWSEYLISVSAFNVQIDGTVLESLPTNITRMTAEGEPGKCKKLKVTSLNSTTLLVEWDRPSEPNGYVNGYIVTYEEYQKLPLDVQTTDNKLTLTGMEFFTTYRVSVRAFNVDFNSHIMRGPSIHADITTEPGVPSIPTALLITNITNSSVDIQWTSPDKSIGPLTGYKVFCNTNDRTYEAEVLGNKTYHTFVDLQPWTKYNVTVIPYNDRKLERLYGPPVSESFITRYTEDGFLNKNLTLLNISTTSVEIFIPTDLFSTQNGDIVQSFLLASAENYIDDNRLFQNGSTIESELKFAVLKLPSGTFHNCSEGMKFTIGSGNECNSSSDDIVICNGPLKPSTKYRIRMRAYTEVGWFQTNPLEAVTAGCRIFESSFMILLTSHLLISFVINNY